MYPTRPGWQAQRHTNVRQGQEKGAEERARMLRERLVSVEERVVSVGVCGVTGLKAEGDEGLGLVSNSDIYLGTRPLPLLDE